ncbi:BPI fold-containing family B member 1 [Lepus europaeus]|uniref:BPI fold-containing family B member 1 n=1 Tax=Lepus europaeus TaxID=9983 RepID=UPI002B4A4B5F|nr:BPI fold-containing family B member 1 [Lepus europaeus]
MAGPWACALLCGLLAATSVEATLSPTAVLSLGPEVIRERLTQELEEHNATVILQQLPLLSTMQDQPTGLLGSLVNSVMSSIIWLKVTSANIRQLQVYPSEDYQELVITIPLDMVAGFNTPLIKTIVQMHMETEAQAVIQVQASKGTPTRLVVSDCSSSHRSLRISLLNKLSFLVNPLAKKVTSLLMPALPDMVREELCPVIEAAFDDMYADLLRLVTVPVALNPGSLQFDLLSPVIDVDVIQFNLVASLVNSEGKVSKWFNGSAGFLTVPTLDSIPVRLIVKYDLVNAAVASLLPPEEFLVLLDYVLPKLARQLKASISAFNAKAASQLGPTQMVKIRTQKSPEILLSQDEARVAQVIQLEVFATEKAHHPLFTLGIEAYSEAQFYSSGDQFVLSFKDISSDRIHLMNSGIQPFNPELLKDVVTDILTSVLLPTQNGKLRPGLTMSMMKALGFPEVVWSLTRNALVITPVPW